MPELLIEDFLLAIFAASSLSYRRETVCKPKPEGVSYVEINDDLNHGRVPRLTLPWLFEVNRRFRPVRVAGKNTAEAESFIR